MWHEGGAQDRRSLTLRDVPPGRRFLRVRKRIWGARSPTAT
ncbi:MAG TPA: hypothetical protein VMZ73_01695 [Acidimicrobiales bacterium]|nr:hypothetical protein [Acidimicrobiales bacterium]